MRRLGWAGLGEMRAHWPGRRPAESGSSRWTKLGASAAGDAAARGATGSALAAPAKARDPDAGDVGAIFLPARALSARWAGAASVVAATFAAAVGKPAGAFGAGPGRGR